MNGRLKTGIWKRGRAAAPVLLISVLAVVCLAILYAGYYYYQKYEQSYMRQVEQQLSSVADLKVSELVQWRKERLGEGAVLYENGNFTDRVRRYLTSPEDGDNAARLKTWIAKIQAAYQYDRIFLVDAHDVERMSVPEAPSGEAMHASQDIAEALRTGEITFLDFHRHAPGQPVHLSVLVPIVDEAAGGKAIAVLVLQIDPEAYLYPLIQRWPVPSKTAETSLVRREGNDVLFLNALRFEHDSALNLRVPLSNLELPAVKMILGGEGIVEGIDYRGVPVIADARAVPDSPWFLIAKIDEAEAFALLKEHLRVLMVLIGALLLTAFASVGFVWRQGTVAAYREKIAAAEALRESEKHYRDILDGLMEGFQIVGKDWRYLYVNDAAARHGRRKQEELLGLTMLEAYPGIEETPMFAAMRAVMETQTPHRMENEFLYPDGSSAWFELNIQPMPEGVSILSVDITDRQLAETALRGSEERFRSTFEQAAVGIAHVSLDGSFVRVNERLCTLLGYTGEEMQRLAYTDITHPDDLELDVEKHKRLLSGELDSYSLEKRYIGKAGAVIWVSLFVALVRNQAGQPEYFVSVVEDISARKQAEDQLHEVMEDLTRSNQELEQFAYVASHDLQEPLRMVASYTQLLERRYKDQLDETANEFIGYAVEGSNRMQRLIQDLLAYSRVTTRGKEFAEADLEEVLVEAMANLQATIEESGAEITHDPLPVVRADSAQMLQLIQNLVGNAVKFYGDEPPRVHVSAGERPKEWVISVKDNGIGIDPQYFDRVFVIFQRLQGRDKYPGTGIGLALSRRIVHRHGGSIWIESEPGKGSVFYFTIPKRGKRNAAHIGKTD